MADHDYDQQWTAVRGLPANARLRFGLTKRHGTPVRFLVQLEYHHAGAWLEVARFDHESDGPPYRDVSRSGLHLDVYRPDGTQIRKVTEFPPRPPTEAMGRAEDFLRDNANQFVRRFEKWL